MANSFYTYLKNNNVKNDIVLFDGDNCRKQFNSDLGYSDSDRYIANERVAKICKTYNNDGTICLVAMISPSIKIRDNILNIIGKNKILFILVDTNIKTCIERDNKGLYRKAINKELHNVTGINNKFEPYTKKHSDNTIIIRNDNLNNVNLLNIFENIKNMIR